MSRTSPSRRLALVTSLTIVLPLTLATLPAYASPGTMSGAPMTATSQLARRTVPDAGGLADLDRRFTAGYRPGAAQRAALRSLGKRVRVSWSPTGTAHSLQARRGALTRPSSASADAIARSFLGSRPALFGLSASEAAAMRLTVRDSYRGTTFLRYQQVSEGLDVYGADVLVTVDAKGRVLIAGGSLARSAASAPAAQLSASSAVGVANRSANPSAKSSTGKRLRSRGDLQRFANNSEARDFDGRPVTAELVKVATSRGVRTAWKVHTEVASNADYLALVDATSGEVLSRQNQVSSDAQGTVFQGEDPEAGGRSQITFPGGWVAAGSKTTSGNNTNTYQDAEGDNSAQADDQPQKDDQHFNYGWNNTWGNGGGAEGDLPLAGDDRDAAVTQLFYYTNWYHDYVYGLGFTESARNFQNDNFGNGGSAGDAVEAESDANFTGKQCKDSANKDVKCLNNANFNANGPDGTKPRMQMYVGDDNNPDGTARRTQRANNRDTVIHEYTHGVSGRIISNGNLAGGAQSGGLGEGWGDALATSINNDPVYGEYNNGNYTRGIRSTAYDANTYDYGDLCKIAKDNMGNFICEEHADGEIWATINWELREALIAKYPATGKDKHEHLIVLGMKNTPDTPSFADARNGYLTADSLQNPTGTPNIGQNYCRLWKVFADDELGTGSNDADDDSTPNVNTSTPAACSPTASIAPVATTPEGTAVSFNGTGSTTGGDPGDSRSYAWDLDNDGQYDDSTSATPSRAYGQDGPRTVGLQITNGSGYTATTSVSFNVTNVAPSVSGTLSGSTAEGSLVTLDASVTDPGWLDPLTATVDWGDGTGTSPLSGSLENNQPDATLTSSATHRYGDNGTYDVKVCGSDDDVQVCVTKPRTVTNVDPSVSLDAITPIKEGDSVLVKGSFTDPGWLDTHTATVDLGDGNGPKPVTLVKTDGGPGTPDSGTFSLTAPYGDDGVFTVTFKVTDDDAGVGQTSRSVTVSNVAPDLVLDKSGAVDVNGVPTIITSVDSTQPFSSNVKDPGSDDETVTWDWNDGAPAPDETSTSLVNPPNIDPDPSPTVQPRNVDFTTQHKFKLACMYDVKLAVTDDDAGTDADGVAVMSLDNRKFASTELNWYGEYRTPGKRLLTNDRSDEQLTCYLKIVRALSPRFSTQRPVNTFSQTWNILIPPLLTPLLNARNQLDATTLAGWLDIADGSMRMSQGVDTDTDLKVDTTFIDLLRKAEAHAANPATPLAVLLDDKIDIEAAILLDKVGETLDVIL